MDPADEASRHAIAAERLRSARMVGWFRFIGISIAFALNLLLPRVVAEAHVLEADNRLFAVYWLAAAAVFWANHRSPWFARLVGLDIAFVDMPFVFFLQWDVVAKNLGSAVPAV